MKQICNISWKMNFEKQFTCKFLGERKHDMKKKNVICKNTFITVIQSFIPQNEIV